MSMMIHCGGTIVDFEDVKNVKPPVKTRTYTPIEHQDLIMNVSRVADNILGAKGYELVDSQYALAYGCDKDDNGEVIYQSDGAKMFGLLSFNRPDCDDTYARSIGIRNSYDKSMSVGWSFGVKVFVCDNLAFTGDITYMRKHTGDVWKDLRHKLYDSLDIEANQTWTAMEDDIEIMKNKQISKRRGYELLGRFYGDKVFTGAHQFNEAFRHWKKPPHEEFNKSNVWGLYNACTHALKTCKPNNIMQRHIQLHNNSMKLIGEA